MTVNRITHVGQKSSIPEPRCGAWCKDPLALGDRLSQAQAPPTPSIRFRLAFRWDSAWGPRDQGSETSDFKPEASILPQPWGPDV